MTKLIDDMPGDISADEFSKNEKGSPMPDTKTIKDTVNKAQPFEILDNKQYQYATFSEKFEKYKLQVDVIKWLIGTVGLSLITIVINKGFKDREQDLVEMTFYDKYASDSVVLNKDNPSNKLMLAQFFAHVAPSEDLRKGWKDYLAVIVHEADSCKRALDSVSNKEEKLTIEYNKNPSKETAQKLSSVTQQKKELENKLTVSFANDIGGANFIKAKQYEQEGFDALLSKDIQNAILNFTMSEKSYNGYHNVSDIAQYLRSIKSPALNDLNTWKSIYKHILTEFSWRMPADVKLKLKDNIK